MTRRMTVALLLALAPLAGPATNRYVSLSGGHVPPFTNWADAATNIQAAVDVSGNGDEIRIAPGRYRADTNSIEATHAVNYYNFYGTNVVYVREKNLALRGDSGNPADVVIDGEGRNRGVGFYNGGGAAYQHIPFLLDSLTISNCYAATNGAAVYWSCPVLVSNWMRNCVIVNNTTASSGAVLDQYKRNATGPCLLLTDTIVRRNQAPGSTCQSTYGTDRIERCILEDNTGIALLLSYGTAEIHQTVFRGNTSVTLQRGAGLSVYRTGTVRVFNSLISGNTCAATMGSGGLYNDRGQPPLVMHSTIVSNVTYGSGYAGGIQSSNQVVNSIVYNNYESNGVLRNYSGVITFTHSCTSPTNAYPDAGNLDAPPGFVDAGGGNFRLAAGSPCINAGTNQPGMDDTTDLDGRPRLDRVWRQPDMGCYEYLPRATLLRLR